MKKHASSIFTILAALFLPGAAPAAPDTVIIRADIIALPQTAADSLIGGADIKDRPAMVLEQLRQLIAKHQAISIANPSFQETLGAHGSSTGLVYLSSQTKGPNLKAFSLLAEIKYAGQELHISSPATLGEVIFAGTFEPGKESPAAERGWTCLVFLRVQ